MKMTLRKTSTGFRHAAALFSFVLLVALAPRAGAHAHLVKSTPAKDAELSTAPGEIDLWFNELLEDGFNTVEVFPASELASAKHSSLTEGKVVLDAKDHTHLIVKLAALKPGEYVVDWRVLSRDSHSAPGRITFTVKGAK